MVVVEAVPGACAECQEQRFIILCYCPQFGIVLSGATLAGNELIDSGDPEQP